MNLNERSQSRDRVSALNMAGVADHVLYRTHWKIEKFANDDAVKAGTPFAVSEVEGNMMMNAGINLMTSLLCGGAGTAYNNANSYLGVGDSSTAESASHTDLQAATNKLRVAMNATYPTYGTSQQAVWQSDFTSAQANYAWNEFAVFNGSTGNTMLNRKVSSQGTKTAGQTWRLTLTITWS